MTQPHFINQIVQKVGINSKMVVKCNLVAATKILQRTEGDIPFDQHFNYRKVVGKLNFLEKITRPDIAYASHQCDRFSDNPS